MKSCAVNEGWKWGQKLARQIMQLLLIAALGASCAQPKQSGVTAGTDGTQISPNPKINATDKGQPAGPKKAGVSHTAGTADGPPTKFPVVKPINPMAGRVVSVNAQLQFVVIDFSFNPLPPIDRRLNVYRQGVRVGEVKVTGPARGTTIVADITMGEAQTNDEVRDD